MSKNNRKGFRLTIETLEDISFTITEHQEKLSTISIINFIDHYRAYIDYYVNEQLEAFTFVKFEVFIANQELINTASRYISQESGEKINPPKAIKSMSSQQQTN